MRRNDPHAKQARETKKNRKAKARRAEVQRRARADRRRGDRQPVVSVGAMRALLELMQIKRPAYEAA
jgi:hypothetical protein